MGKPSDAKKPSGGSAADDPLLDDNPPAYDLEAGPSAGPSTAPFPPDADAPISVPDDGDDGAPPPAYSPDTPPPKPPSSFSLSPAAEVLTTARLQDSPARLENFFAGHISALPPTPFVRLKGSHLERTTENNGSGTSVSRNRLTDFDMVFSLADSVAPANGRVVDLHKLRAACDGYHRSRSLFKQLKVGKKVFGIDEVYLEEHLERMVRAENYLGRVEVTFESAGGSVLIAPPGWLSTLRYGPARWFFYLTFLWIVIWPVLWLLTKKYDGGVMAWDAVPGREQAWCERYKRVVGYLARARKQGFVKGAELEGVREGMERRGRLGGGQRSWLGGVIEGIVEAAEGLQGGWGADEGFVGGLIGGRSGGIRIHAG